MYNTKENKLKLLKLIKNKVDRLVSDDKIIGEVSIGLDKDDMYDLEIEDWEYLKSLLKKLRKERIFYFQEYTGEEISYYEKSNICTISPIMIIVDKDFDKKYNKFLNKNKGIAKGEEIFKNILGIPPKTSWEDITIKFLNKFDIQIYIKNKPFKKINNVELGFCDNKQTDKVKCDKQWEFLIGLSLMNGEFNLKAQTLTPERERNRQYKMKLSDKLRLVFGIDDSPFCDVKDLGVYKTKFKLEPVPILRGDGESFGISEEGDDRFADFDEVYKEKTVSK